MKIRPAMFAVLKIACVLFFLTGCFGGLGSFNFGSLNSGSLTFATVSVSPRPVSIAAGATQTFTATTTNSVGAATGWSLDTSGLSTGAAGTLSATTGDTITYTAPSTPPIYTLPTSSTTPQGTVYLTASVNPTNGNIGGFTSLQFVITAPSVSVGLSPATPSVALGATQQFSGYAVGSVTQGLTWQVNGVTGGSMSYGTITQSSTWPYGGLYTAPAIMPMTGPNVTITVISQADPTKTQTAVVTLH
jgi:hypothetical protein